MANKALAVQEFSVEGIPELKKQIEALGEKTGGKILKSAARKAMGIARKDARKRGRPISKRLGKNISIKLAKQRKRSKHRVKFLLGFRGNPRDKTDDKSVWWGMFWEVGFAAGGKTPVKARPMIRPALETKQREMITFFGQEMKKQIIEVARKGKK